MIVLMSQGSDQSVLWLRLSLSNRCGLNHSKIYIFFHGTVNLNRSLYFTASKQRGLS